MVEIPGAWKFEDEGSAEHKCIESEFNATSTHPFSTAFNLTNSIAFLDV